MAFGLVVAAVVEEGEEKTFHKFDLAEGGGVDGLADVQAAGEAEGEFGHCGGSRWWW